MSLTKATYSMISGAPINVLDYGASPSASAADNTTALNLAFSQTGKSVFIPAGTYNHNELDAPTCSEIIGEGELVSILKPSSTVTVGLSIVTAGPHLLRGFKIDGSATTDAQGLFLGNGQSWAGQISEVRVSGFTGTNAVGVRVDKVLKTNITKLTSELNTRNMLIQQSLPALSAFPTTVRFDSCVFTGAVTKGVEIADGHGISFTNTDFESSGQQGLLIDTDAGRDVIDIYIGEGCWFENNYNDNPAEFHARVGTNNGTNYIRAIFDGVFFSTNGSSAASAIWFDGSEVDDFNVRNVRLAAETANAIKITNSARGAFNTYPSYLSYPYTVLDSAGNGKGDVSQQGHWVTYTPTIYSNIGNQATTFASTTIDHCRYKQIGRTLIIDYSISGTLNAVTPTSIYVTLPQLPAYPSPTLQHTSEIASILTENSVFAVGRTFAYQPDGLIYNNKINSATFASGATVSFRVQIILELT